VEYLGSLDAIAREKGRLIEALPPDGVAVLNAMIHAWRRWPRTSRACYYLWDAAKMPRCARENHCARDGTRLDVRWQGMRSPYTSRTSARTTLIRRWPPPLWAWLTTFRGKRSLLVCSCAATARAHARLTGINGSEILDDSLSPVPNPPGALETLRALACAAAMGGVGPHGPIGRLCCRGPPSCGAVCAEVADELVVKGDWRSSSPKRPRAMALPAARIHIAYTASEAAQSSVSACSLAM
jgi:hypothetical protein